MQIDRDSEDRAADAAAKSRTQDAFAAAKPVQDKAQDDDWGEERDQEPEPLEPLFHRQKDPAEGNHELSTADRQPHSGMLQSCG